MENGEKTMEYNISAQDFTPVVACPLRGHMAQMGCPLCPRPLFMLFQRWFLVRKSRFILRHEVSLGVTNFKKSAAQWTPHLSHVGQAITGVKSCAVILCRNVGKPRVFSPLSKEYSFWREKNTDFSIYHSFLYQYLLWSAFL